MEASTRVFSIRLQSESVTQSQKLVCSDSLKKKKKNSIWIRQWLQQEAALVFFLFFFSRVRKVVNTVGLKFYFYLITYKTISSGRLVKERDHQNVIVKSNTTVMLWFHWTLFSTIKPNSYSNLTKDISFLLKKNRLSHLVKNYLKKKLVEFPRP